MTKKELIELLAKCSVNNFYVISKPDYNGGRQNYLLGGLPKDVNFYPFEYIEWQGDKQKLIKDRKQCFVDIYITKEAQYENHVSLENLFDKYCFYMSNFSS